MATNMVIIAGSSGRLTTAHELRRTPPPKQAMMTGPLSRTTPVRARQTRLREGPPLGW
jgi:hypothetical protein